jgi:hypothetical protein
MVKKVSLDTLAGYNAVHVTFEEGSRIALLFASGREQ